MCADHSPPSENFLRLEAMAASAVPQFLGKKGLYIDGVLVAKSHSHKLQQQQKQQEKHTSM